MRKLAQYGDPFASTTHWAAMPIGLGLGLYGLNKVWSGSPSLQSAAMVGLPMALWNYMKYRDVNNAAQSLASEQKAFYDKLRADPNAAYIPQSSVAASQQSIQDSVMGRYAEPARSALSDSLPYFALGAALPMALSAVRGR